jgi:hypothetical protein
MPGLPFSPLPASVTAESIFQQQTDRQKKLLQDQFTLAWDELNSRGQTIGSQKRDELQSELYAKARAQAMELEATVQSQMDLFKQIDQMDQAGQFVDAPKYKLRLVLGAGADQYFPGETDPVKQFADLEAEENILDRRLARFRLVSESPTYTGHRHWYAPLAEKGKMLPGPATLLEMDLEWVYNDKTQSWTRKVVNERKATNEAIDFYETGMARKDRIQEMKTEVLNQVDVATQFRRIGLGKMGETSLDKKLTTSILTAKEVAEGWTGYGPSFRSTAPQEQPAATPQTAGSKTYKVGDTRVVNGVTYTFDGRVWRS